jgi:probable rRNA maturation factor
MMQAADTITVVIESARAEAAGLDPAWLTTLLEFALRTENAPPSAVTLLVTDDEGIQTLHRDYLNDDTPTDVLAFAAQSDESFPIEPGYGDYLGDIAVSWDTAALQGPEAGLSVHHEIAFLALHGLLHLLGADDATEAERAAMHDRQQALLAAFLASEPRA